MWLFLAIFQVAQNWLKFGMSTLFVLKNVPVVFFFKNAEKYGQNCVKLTPPLSSSKQHRISIPESQNTVRVSFTLLDGGRGGGGGGGVVRSAAGDGLSRMCLKPCFPAGGKKNTDIFSQKRMTLTSQISAVVTSGRLAQNPSIVLVIISKLNKKAYHSRSDQELRFSLRTPRASFSNAFLSSSTLCSTLGKWRSRISEGSGTSYKLIASVCN